VLLRNQAVKECRPIQWVGQLLKLKKQKAVSIKSEAAFF
jgi:hypothetical protein